MSRDHVILAVSQGSTGDLTFTFLLPLAKFIVYVLKSLIFSFFSRSASFVAGFLPISATDFRDVCLNGRLFPGSCFYMTI